MALDNLEERLAEMQEAFDKAPVEGGWDELPPDGDYQALVRGFDFFESKAGVAFLKTELEIALHSEYTGRRADTIHNLEDPERIGWLKKHLATLGADVENLDLRTVRPGSQILADLLDVPVSITIKTSDRKDDNGNPYRNVYVNDRLGNPLNGTPESDVPAPDVEPEPAATGGDSDIPFARPRRRDREVRRRDVFPIREGDGVL